jgi:hypothetical protein
MPKRVTKADLEESNAVLRGRLVDLETKLERSKKFADDLFQYVVERDDDLVRDAHIEIVSMGPTADDPKAYYVVRYIPPIKFISRVVATRFADKLAKILSQGGLL